MKAISVIAIAAAIALAAGAAPAQDRMPSMVTPDQPPNAALKSPDRMAAATLAKGHNSFTRSQAQRRMEQAGYDHVADLVLDSDGVWRANATRAGHPIKVGLDYKGNVAGL
jgi:putative membrane protein